MSKYNRNKHIKVIELLYKANSTVAKLAKEGRVQESLFLLADCQDAAVALGSHIEKLHGLGTKTVSMLEAYCEALYQLSEALNEGVQIEEATLYLKETTQLIVDTYKIEFPEKKEVVFLPYNASMWDSFESVWRAASSDDNCEVYVVPIPYYDKNPNGGFESFHYEGDKLPDYVPTTYYEEYDVELRKPDVIYIHNPYDDCNYVTSVEPSFYSSKLVEHTNMLVYIPYFVVDETRDMKKVEHFACLPAVFNAHKVIVQSEVVKKLYVEALTKRIEGVNRREWEKKILAIGSPKYDAVYHQQNNLTNIPEEWKDIIGQKKVVLYNTHLSLLMVDKSEKFLKKLRGVIRLFSNRSDVVLLWRPHPLAISTAQAMNPQVLEEYMEIVNDFRDKKIGIYDDTPDMQLAIAISDAYYGSDSSGLPLYKATGKPVLIHSIYVDTEE